MFYFIVVNLFIFHMVMWFLTQGPNIIKSLMRKFDERANPSDTIKTTFSERFYCHVRYFGMRYYGMNIPLYRIKNVPIRSWIFWHYYMCIVDQPIENNERVIFMGRNHDSFWRELNKGWYEFNNVRFATITGTKEVKNIIKKQ